MVKEIPLGSRKYPGMVALVDDEDYDSVMQCNWYVQCNPRVHIPDAFYARRCYPTWNNGKRVKVYEYMHRFLIETGRDVDHKDHDGLNNQRSNLRPANKSLNQANNPVKRPSASSRFRGVSWNQARQKWGSSIRVNSKSMWLGWYAEEESAAHAYDEAADHHFGEFACLNFSERVVA